MISVPTSPGMNNRKLDTLIRRMGDKIDGHPGYWEFNYFDSRLVCITDESHDRMRVMTPIAQVDDLDDELIMACLAANFDRALDARYCINSDTLWGAFIHPLYSLTDDQFHSACSQVAEVARTFGSTFSSGELAFGEDAI